MSGAKPGLPRKFRLVVPGDRESVRGRRESASGDGRCASTEASVFVEIMFEGVLVFVLLGECCLVLWGVLGIVGGCSPWRGPFF